MYWFIYSFITNITLPALIHPAAERGREAELGTSIHALALKPVSPVSWFSVITLAQSGTGGDCPGTNSVRSSVGMTRCCKLSAWNHEHVENHLCYWIDDLAYNQHAAVPAPHSGWTNTRKG